MDVDALIEQSEALAKKRVSDMPTNQAAFNAAKEAFSRLFDLGWREVSYCPKDGTLFEAFDVCLNPFTCHYSGA